MLTQMIGLQQTHLTQLWSYLHWRRAMETLGPCATGPRLTKPQDTAADLLAQAGSKSSALACAESRKEIRRTMLPRCATKVAPGNGEEGGTRTPPEASASTSCFPGKLQGLLDVWGHHRSSPFQTDNGGILPSFAQSFVPLFIIPADYVSGKRGNTNAH